MLHTYYIKGWGNIISTSVKILHLLAKPVLPPHFSLNYVIRLAGTCWWGGVDCVCWYAVSGWACCAVLAFFSPPPLTARWALVYKYFIIFINIITILLEHTSFELLYWSNLVLPSVWHCVCLLCTELYIKIKYHFPPVTWLLHKGMS